LYKTASAYILTNLTLSFLLTASSEEAEEKEMCIW